MLSGVRWLGAAALAAAILMPADAEAQQRRRGQQQPAAPERVPEVTLVYEREVFTYQAGNRRDPFVPLTDDAMGPRFEDLALQGIIYSTGQGRSLALLTGRDGRIYRVRVGDVIGNSRVVEIGPLRVVLAVETFGVIRNEMLELRKNQGANQ